MDVSVEALPIERCSDAGFPPQEAACSRLNYIRRPSVGATGHPSDVYLEGSRQRVLTRSVLVERREAYTV